MAGVDMPRTLCRVSGYDAAGADAMRIRCMESEC